MSSRLAKSTSKFRPVKPQPKKQGTPTVSSSSAGVTPSASPAPSNQLAPQQSSAVDASFARSSQLDHHDSSAVPAEVTRAGVAVATTATTDEDNTDNVQAPPPPASSITPSVIEPTSEAPSNRNEQPAAAPVQPSTSDSPAPPPTETSQVTRPKPKRIPSVIPRSSPLRKRAEALALSSADEPPSSSSTQEAQLTVPVQPSSSSAVSQSRQGTPLSIGGSSFAVGSSWQALEGATQVSATPSSQSPANPDSQATVVAPSSSQKEPLSSTEVQASEKATIVAEPTSSETSTPQTVEVSPVEPPSQSSASTSISHALPPLPTPLPAAPSLPPLPPGHTSDNDDDEDGHANRPEEDEDGDGEAEPSGLVPPPQGEGSAEQETEATEVPAKKKRGRPPGSGRGAAKGKKATTPRSRSKSSRGAERMNGEAEGEEAEENAEIEDNDEEEGETALDAPVKKKRKTPTTAKRKAPSKSATKKSSKKKKPTPVEGEQNAEEDDEEEEYDENGVIIYEPWEISKLHPGYSLNTRDIYAAVGIEIPESFAFTTAQDIAEINEEDEDAEEGLQGEDDTREGLEGDEANVEDGEQAEEEYREDEEENGEGGTTPWQPFGKAIDPTMTTMRQLTEDTGRGRITPKLVNNMTEKINRKQMLKWAREKMKLRQSLNKAGLDPEAIERRLDEHMHALMHGSGVVEFTEGDRSVHTGHLIAPNRLQTEKAASVRGDGDDRSRNGTPYDGDTSGQPLFRPEGNSDEEGDGNAHRHFDDKDGQDRGEEYDEDGYEGMMETQFAPQMRFVDGQFVLDEASTQIVRDNAAREGFAIVEDTTDSRRITSASWGKRGTASRWTMADTDLFYEGLTQFGTDFELISRMFSNRTRRQIKAKFVREEKIDSERLEEALSGKKKIDINFYERMTKLDFRNGMVPADPMAKFYDGLPTADSAVKLESNREPSPSHELDLAALLRKKKEDTAGLGGWENSRAPQEYDGNGQEAIPEEENEGEEGEHYEEEHGEGHDDEMEGQFEHEEAGYRSPTPEQQDEPFDFTGGIQLRVSG